MAQTWFPIQWQSLGTAATSVTFSSVPAAGYRDLAIVVNGTTTTSTIDAIVMRFNGDTASNYSAVYMNGDGTTASSSTQATTYVTSGLIGNSQSVTTIQIMDYAQTDKHKTVLARGNQAGWGTRAGAGRWASTSAISTILIYTEAGLTFSAGTTFALYGIA